MLRKVFMLSIFVLLIFSSLTLSQEPEDPYDPRWIKLSPWINPRATYLRTCHDDPLPAIKLNMLDYDLNYDDWVVLRRKGSFLNTPGATYKEKLMTGVFSTSTTLLDDEVTRQHRVPDAVSVPLDSPYTWPTWNECIEHEGEDPKQLETDIPEDFTICCTDGGAAMLRVPAQYLFVGPWSRWFQDNIDPEMDYKVEFSDEVKWNQHSGTCETCWNDNLNWDVELVPIPEVGVTFEAQGFTEVSGYELGHFIKFLRIVDGAEVKFEGGTGLQTLIDTAEKYSFLVDGAKMYWAEGSLFIYTGYIGYHANGELDIYNSSSFIVNDELKIGDFLGSSGKVSVHGNGSTLDAMIISVGDLGSGNLAIFDEGYVSATLIGIGGGNRALGMVTVKSGGKLDGGRMIIKDRGSLIIDQGDVNMPNGIDVYTGGGIRGCNSGFVTGHVKNYGGFVEPGCSTGKLAINGNYIQESAGTLVIEVGGYNKGEEYDVLEVTGNVTLNGTLQVNFINGFAPKQGDVFEFTNVAGSASKNLSKVETNCVADDFQYNIDLVEGKLTMTALNNARAIPCGGPKAMPWIPLLLLED